MKAELLEPHRRYLWGLCYRLTGSSADADDLVQDTFERALSRPPADQTRDLRPWLTKVALNLGRDALRRRRSRAYVGPWLPAPIETGDEPPSAEARLADGESTAGRYALMESVSMAFLVALEVLSPKQRAVLLLRDVFDHTGAEAAGALDLTVTDVKVTLHRARNKLAGYDAHRRPPSAELTARTQDVLGRLIFALGTQDRGAVDAVLAEETAAFSDGGSEFLSARRVIYGRDRVARFLLSLAAKRAPTAVEWRTINGLPALILGYQPEQPRLAPKAVLACSLDASDQIIATYAVMATDKLIALQ